MAENIPYWQGYETLNARNIPNKSIETDLRKRILNLTPAARLQLFYAVETGGGALQNLSNFQIRNLGINTNNTSKELLESELVLPSYSSEAFESAHSKKELIELCESHDITYRKSWNKGRLVGALEEIDSAGLEKIAKNINLVSPNYQVYPELKTIINIADEHQIGFKLLCFA